MKSIYLKTPEVEELYYRQKWMMDPETKPEFREAGLCHRTGWAGHPSADDIQ